MARKIFQILFFIFGLLTIFFIVSSILASRRFDYLIDNKEMLNESDYDFVSMTLISFNNDGTKTYVAYEPLYKETFEDYSDDSLRYKLSISIYSTIESKKNTYKDGFVIVLDDIVVNDLFMDVDIHEMPILKLSTTVNEKPSSFETKYLEDPFLIIPGSNKRVAFFHLDSFKTANDYAQIEKMVISYQLKNDLPDKTLVILSNKNLDNFTYEDVFNPLYNRDIENVVPNNIVFNDKTNLENNDLIFYNPLHLKLFKQTNKLFILPLTLDFIFLITAYYLLFYHKYVIIKLKERRLKKKEQMLLLEEQFKNNKEGEK